MDRREFVQGAVAAAGTAALAAGGYSIARPAVVPRPPPGPPVDYFGCHRVGGPAPRGTPLIPIRVNGDGEIEGVPDATGPDGANVLAWYRYCGHAGAPGLSLDYAGDDVLRYHLAEEKLRQGVEAWYADRLGDPLRPEHFAPGAGAAFSWRSAGATGAHVVTGVVVRAPSLQAFDAEPPRYVPPARALRPNEREQLRREFLLIEDERAFVASSTYCPHFCCLPAWKEAEDQAIAVQDPVNGGNAWERILCTCHYSIYHPFQIVRYTFRPDVRQ